MTKKQPPATEESPEAEASTSNETVPEPTAASAPEPSSEAAITAPSAPAAPVPGPAPMLESEARTWAMLVHILAVVATFLSASTLAFVAPLVIWLIYKERSALVDHHGKQNLNLQLSVLLVGILAVVIGVATVGFGFLITLPVWGVYWLYSIVISIIAGVKANAGEYYNIPAIIHFVK